MNTIFSIENIFTRIFPRSYTFGPHHHDFFEINYIKKGWCSLFFAGKPVFLTKGDCIVIMPGKPHFFKVAEQGETALLQMSFSIKDKLIIEDVFQDKKNQNFLKFPSSEELPQCLGSIGKRLNSNSPLKEQYIQLKLKELMILLKEAALNKHGGNERNTNAAAAMEYLENNFVADINLEELGNELGISSRGLRKIFRKEYGTSPIETLTELRLAKAEKLLAETNLKIIDIALASGFHSAQWFSRVFCKKIGMTPLHYRSLFKAGKNGHSLGWTMKGSEKYLKTIPEGSFLGIEVPFN